MKSSPLILSLFAVPFFLFPTLSSSAGDFGQNAVSPEWGVTAYASSFTKADDPRGMINGEGAWRPQPEDTQPKLNLIWPGEVLARQIVIKGEFQGVAISLRAGVSRFALQTISFESIEERGKVVLKMDPPVLMRIAEIGFQGGKGARIDSVQLEPTDAIGGNAPLLTPNENIVEAGDIANLSFPPPKENAEEPGPWLFEAELAESTPFRATQDYRAFRALMMTSDLARFTVSPWATEGDYTVFRSRLGNAKRERLGTLRVNGLPNWQPLNEPGKGSGYSKIGLSLHGQLLPHLEDGAERLPFIVFALAAPSFEKIAAYASTGARLWKINTTHSPLLATPDLSENVAGCIAEMEVNIRQILALAPESRILIAPDLRPRKGWLERYPEEVFRASDGRGGEGANFGSTILNAHIQQALEELVRELEKKPYASRIAGVLPYFGRGGDGWGYGVDLTIGVPREKVVLGDRSPAEEQAFVQWLEDNYGTPLSETLPPHWPAHALRRTPRVPPDAALAERGNGLLLDPQKHQDIIDYWRYRANSVASTIVSAGESVKRASQDRLLYGAHYGYVMSARNLAPAFAQLGGHFDLSRLLNSEAVDLINGGSSGDKRGAAENYEPLTPIGSVLLHRKLPVVELDNRSPFTRGVPPYEYYQLYSISEWIDAARRDVGFAITHQAGLWWYDMSTPAAANPYNREPWFIEDRFLALVKETIGISGQPSEASGMESPVAVFMDEDVVLYQDVYATFVYENLNRAFIESLSAAGPGFRCYLLSDYPRWSQSREAGAAKIEVFLNAWLEPKTGWSAWAASPRAQLWMVGAALASRKHLHAQPLSEPLIGVTLKEHEELSVSDSRLVLAPALQNEVEGGARYALKPFSSFHRSQAGLFGEKIAPYYLPEPSAGVSILAEFSNGAPGLIRWQGATGGLRFFSALPYLPANVLRGLYQQAGIGMMPPQGPWYLSEGRGLLVINARRRLSGREWIQAQGASLFQEPENANSWILIRSPSLKSEK